MVSDASDTKMSMHDKDSNSQNIPTHVPPGKPGLRHWTSHPVVGAILAVVALALRAWQLDSGLPDFIEEAVPFKKAFEMWGWDTGRIDLDPDFFNYPTLSIYLHFLAQQAHYAIGHLFGWFSSTSDYWIDYHLDPSVHVLVARMLSVVADVLSVLAVWRIGERARPGSGMVAAILLVFASASIKTSRLIFTDPIMTAFALWSLERLLAYGRGGSRRTLLQAIVLIGLAAGTKYPAGFLVLPLAWTLWNRHGRGGLKWWRVAVAGAVMVFLMTSPFIVLSFEEFWLDFTYERGHMAGGHLGMLEHRGASYYLQTLGNVLGWHVVALALASLFLLATRILHREPRHTLILLWSLLAPYAMSISGARMAALRYSVPLAALVSLCGAIAILAAADRYLSRFRPPRHRAGLAVVLAAIVVLPAMWGGIPAAAAGSDTTFSQARRWCEANFDQETIIVQESWGAGLRTQRDIRALSSQPAFSRASMERREAYTSSPQYRSVVLPLATQGDIRVGLTSVSGDRESVILFAHAADLNAIYYDPALYAGVDIMLTSSTVRGRYEANPERFEVQRRFYDYLERSADEVVRFTPHGTIIGSEIRIYRMPEIRLGGSGETARALNPYWWVDGVPKKIRLAIEEIGVPQHLRTGGEVWSRDGRPAAWMRGLWRFYDRYVRVYLGPLSQHLAELDRCEEARAYSGALLAVMPKLDIASARYSHCASRMGDWGDARAVLMGTLAALRAPDRASFHPDSLPEGLSLVFRLQVERVRRHFIQMNTTSTHSTSAGGD